MQLIYVRTVAHATGAVSAAPLFSHERLVYIQRNVEPLAHCVAKFLGVCDIVMST